MWIPVSTSFEEVKWLSYLVVEPVIEIGLAVADAGRLEVLVLL